MSLAASTQGVFVERCAQCGRDDLLPRGFCARCGSKQVAVHLRSGRGIVWSVTTLHRPARTSASEPATIALVALAEGLRVMVRATDGLSIGAEVEVASSGLGEPPRLVGAPG